MSEDKINTSQGNENKSIMERFDSGLNWSRKWLGKIDSNPLVNRAMFIITGLLFWGGFYLYRQVWLDIVDLSGYAGVMDLIMWVAGFVVLVNFFETMSRNDFGDFIIVVVSAIAMLWALNTGQMTMVVLMYAGGISLTHYACHSGKLDWSPMVGLNALYVMGATYMYGMGAVSILVPILLAMVFAVAEVLRYKNAQAIRIALPVIFVAGLGIIFTSVNAMWFVIPGLLLTTAIIPTALQFDKNERFGSKMTKFAGKPLASFNNNMSKFYVDLEAGSLTAVFMMVALFISVMP